MGKSKNISIKEMETIMATKSGVFDASSVDKYSMSIDLVCTGVQFEKTNDGEDLAMVLLVGNSEVQIDPDIIEEIYLGANGEITIEFDENLPDLEIRFRG